MLFQFFNFSDNELPKNCKTSKLDSIAVEDLHNSLDIKSIKIHLNDGSCQGSCH